MVGKLLGVNPWAIFGFVGLAGLIVWLWLQLDKKKDEITSLSSHVTELQVDSSNTHRRVNGLEKDSLRLSSLLSDCRAQASDQKVGFLEQKLKLQEKIQQNQKAVAATPADKVRPGIIKNLVEGGYLTASPGTDSLGKVKTDSVSGGWTIDYTAAENRALLEATGMVSVKQQSWDDLANGYARAETDVKAQKEKIDDLDQKLKDCETANEQLVREKLARRQRGFFGRLKCKIFGCKG